VAHPPNIKARIGKTITARAKGKFMIRSTAGKFFLAAHTRFF
jgi:hypothetical protein